MKTRKCKRCFSSYSSSIVLGFVFRTTHRPETAKLLWLTAFADCSMNSVHDCFAACVHSEFRNGPNQMLFQRPFAVLEDAENVEDHLFRLSVAGMFVVFDLRICAPNSLIKPAYKIGFKIVTRRSNSESAAHFGAQCVRDLPNGSPNSSNAKDCRAR